MLAGMQGTVKTFSEETRSGAVLLDDGTEIAIPPAVFSASGLRKLQFGQRVSFTVAEDGDPREMTAITIVTLAGRG
jgi:cold shock CspA family protein